MALIPCRVQRGPHGLDQTLRAAAADWPVSATVEGPQAHRPRGGGPACGRDAHPERPRLRRAETKGGRRPPAGSGPPKGRRSMAWVVQVQGLASAFPGAGGGKGVNASRRRLGLHPCCAFFWLLLV